MDVGLPLTNIEKRQCLVTSLPAVHRKYPLLLEGPDLDLFSRACAEARYRSSQPYQFLIELKKLPMLSIATEFQIEL